MNNPRGAAVLFLIVAGMAINVVLASAYAFSLVVH